MANTLQDLEKAKMKIEMEHKSEKVSLKCLKDEKERNKLKEQLEEMIKKERCTMQAEVEGLRRQIESVNETVVEGEQKVKEADRELDTLKERMLEKVEMMMLKAMNFEMKCKT